MAPSTVMDVFKTFYKGSEKPPSPFTLSFAVFMLTLYVFAYVAPFYLSATIRPSATLRRDATEVIKGRIRSVAISTSMIVITTFSLVTFIPKSGNLPATLHLMGFVPAGLYEAARVLLLTMILFVGPLFESAICEGEWRDWIRLPFVTCLWDGTMTLNNFRTLLAGPVTEELLFRSAALPLFLLTPQGSNLKTLFFVPPIVFGLAHVHHLHEFRLTNQHAPLYIGIVRSIFQLAYTTLFGSFVTFTYLRTGSLLGAVLAHIFCNYMGLPRVWGRVTGGDGGGAEAVMGPDVGKKNDDGEHLARQLGGPKEIALGWSVAYYALLPIGAYGFYRYFWVLTESDNALLKF